MVFDLSVSIVHLHIRSLSDVLDTAREFGRSCIPILVKKHPTLREQMKLDWLNKSGISGVLGRMVFLPVVYQFVKLIGLLFNNIAVPAIIYDYLLFWNYNKGLSESQIEGDTLPNIQQSKGKI